MFHADQSHLKLWLKPPIFIQFPVSDKLLKIDSSLPISWSRWGQNISQVSIEKPPNFTSFYDQGAIGQTRPWLEVRTCQPSPAGARNEARLIRSSKWLPILGKYGYPITQLTAPSIHHYIVYSKKFYHPIISPFSPHYGPNPQQKSQWNHLPYLEVS